MSKFELYNIVLKDMKDETRTYEFDLDDAYFKKIDSPEVQRGNVKAKVVVSKKISTYELQFILEGNVIVPCNRCLDDMDQAITYKETLQVKLGDKFDEVDEIVIIPESEGALNVAWFMYEFIILNIPIKHVHPTGECNKTMVSKLKRHIARHKDDDDDNDLDFDDDDDMSNDEVPTDPRWDGLQNILENN
ncbi:MAG: hypothetical protein RIS29_2819 [Bacteroidota bacterium]